MRSWSSPCGGEIKGRLDTAHLEDAAQKCRIELVPKGFLLAARDLHKVSREGQAANWPEAFYEQGAGALTKRIYMVAPREVVNIGCEENR